MEPDSQNRNQGRNQEKTFSSSLLEGFHSARFTHQYIEMGYRNRAISGSPKGSLVSLGGGEACSGSEIASILRYTCFLNAWRGSLACGTSRVLLKTPSGPPSSPLPLGTFLALYITPALFRLSHFTAFAPLPLNSAFELPDLLQVRRR